MEEKISKKQEQFCLEVIKEGNLTLAYEKSYSCSRMNKMTIGTNASKLAAEPKIKARIKQLQDELKERNLVTVDELIGELANMIRFDPADMYDELGDLKSIHEMPKPVRQMIASLDVQTLFSGRGDAKEHIGYIKKVKLMDKLGAIEKLMKHLGGYEKDNSQKQGEVVVFQLPDNKR